MQTKIAVTGVCSLSGAGDSASALYGHSSLGKIIMPQINDKAYEEIIASLDVGPYEINRIQKILLTAFLKSSSMADLPISSMCPERIGIFLGNSYGIEGFKTEFFRVYKNSDPALTSPTLFPFTTANVLASWLAIQVKAKGPNLTFVNGTISSSEAILAACDALINNECDFAFVGGINVISNELSDDFYSSGFRHEVVGMLVLEKSSCGESSERKPLGYIKEWHRTKLSQKKLEKMKFEKSLVCIDDESFICFRDYNAEVIHLGNNLGEDYFQYDKVGVEPNKGKHRVCCLSDVIGNVFDASGVLGLAFSIESMNGLNNGNMRNFALTQDNIACSNIDSDGSVVTILISKK
jgi:hypothetical protein